MLCWMKDVARVWSRLTPSPAPQCGLARYDGPRVEAGDIVMVVESDKADMDVEAFESGFLAKILVPQVA